MQNEKSDFELGRKHPDLNFRLYGLGELKTILGVLEEHQSQYPRGHHAEYSRNRHQCDSPGLGPMSAAGL